MTHMPPLPLQRPQLIEPLRRARAFMRALGPKSAAFTAMLMRKSGDSRMTTVIGQRSPLDRLKAPFAALTIAAVLGFAALAEARTPLDDAQMFVLEEINRKVNAMRTLHGEFTQIGPYGEQANGSFILSRPGRMRFEYHPPSPLLIVANGRWVGITDMKERSTERYPLASTPLKLLLAKDVDLLGDTTVKDVLFGADIISVTLEERTGDSIGELTLLFDSASLELKQWIVTDAQGLQTVVSLYNTQTEGEFARRLFVIPDYDRVPVNEN